MDTKPYFNHGYNGVASTNFETDLQTKSITSLFIDNIFQDTWLLALTSRNRPGVTVNNALYQHCENMIEQVQKNFAHCVFWDEAVTRVAPRAKRQINTTTQFLFYPDEKPWEAVNPRILRGVITSVQPCERSADMNHCN